MPPTKAELLTFLEQLQTQYPQMNKQQLTALALAYFNRNSNTNDDQPIPNQNAVTPAKMDLQTTSAELVIDSHDLDSTAKQIDAEAEPLPAPDIEQVETTTTAIITPSKERQGINNALPVTTTSSSHKLQLPLILLSVFIVFLGIGIWIFQITEPAAALKAPEATPAPIKTEAPPADIGHLSNFADKFIGDEVFYNNKYQHQLLEIIGTVEFVKLNPQNELEIQLRTTERSRSAFRARFRFLPNQQPPLELKKGDLAVLKGRYLSYSDKIIHLYPAVIIYHNANTQLPPPQFTENPAS